MVLYHLGNGNNVFTTTRAVDEWTGVVIYGDNGADNIALGVKVGALASAVTDATGYGGNGNDTLSTIGDRNSLFAGNGDDVLTLTGTGDLAMGGNGNDHLITSGLAWHYGRTAGVLAAVDIHLDGGAGDDVLESHSTASALFSFSYTAAGSAGTVMTGGAGKDGFILRNSSDLIVTNDSDGVVGQGDVIRGVLDEILDYQQGESIGLNAPTMAGSVGLSQGPQHIEPAIMGGDAIPLTDAHQHLLLGDGVWASFRGDLTNPGEFTVSQDGQDLMLVYDTADDVDSLFNQGAVVLHGITEVSQVLFA